MSVTMTIDTLPVARFFQLLGTNLRDMRTPMARCAVIATASVQQNFRVGGRPAWQPLSEVTLRIRRTRVYPPKAPSKSTRILIDLGLLRASWQRGAAGNVYRITSNSGEIGTNLPYADIQQNGGAINFSRRAGKRSGGGIFIPARPYATLQPQDADDMAEVVADWIVERVGRP